jgi:hypothetical protein
LKAVGTVPKGSAFAQAGTSLFSGEHHIQKPVGPVMVIVDDSDLIKAFIRNISQLYNIVEAANGKTAIGTSSRIMRD